MALACRGYCSWLVAADPYMYGSGSGAVVSGGRIQVRMNGTDRVEVGGVNTNDITPGSIYYATARAVSVDSVGDAEGTVRKLGYFGAPTGQTLRTVVSGSGYLLRLVDAAGATIATGCTVYSWGDANRYDLRVTTFTGRTRIEFGGTLEIDVAQSVSVGSLGFFCENVDATKYVRAGEMGYYQGDTEATDRPAVSPSGIVVFDPNSDTSVHFNAFNVIVNPDESPAVSKWKTVNDWASGAANDNYNRNESPATPNTTFRQTWQTGNQTIPTNMLVLMEYQRALKTVGGKNLNWLTIISDGTNYREDGSSNPVETSYGYTRRAWHKAPDNTAWDQTDLNNLQIGARASVLADAVALRVTAAHAEAVGVATGDALSPTPACAGGDRRRLLAQVI